MLIDVDDLTEPERALWGAFPRGELVDLRTGDAADDDPAGGGEWGADRTVRADVLVALLRGAQAVPAGLASAVRLAGARVRGQLDLACATIVVPVLLEDCRLERMPNFSEASTRTMRFLRCTMPGFNGELARIDGRISFDDSFIQGRLLLSVRG